MRQKGFQYLVRRPVHPDALRLLLRYALYQSPDRRERVRHPIGCEVRWRVGWQRDRGAMLEISTGGCTLLASHDLSLDTQIVVKIPREIAGSETLKLRGTVIRCTADATRSEPDRTLVAVEFDRLTDSARVQLTELCVRWSEGPPKLPNDSPLDSRVETPRSPGSPSETDSSRAETSSEIADRRTTRRSVFNREIVEVDTEGRAVQGLLARDLSPGGIRVDPQFGLEPGDKLQLALFDTSLQEPLIVMAEVATDDGDAGLGLQFVDLSDETKARIDDMIANLPAVVSLGADGDASSVLAGIVSNES
jgi:c-di-GMP-binding flagellar brake protein YcgR